MANLGQAFNSSEVQPNQFECIPKGDYLLAITDSDVVENSAKTGSILKLTVEVLDGQYKGRKLFDQINLSNPNDMAVKIGRERLSAYCHATGVAILNDSQQLHNIPFTGRVVIKVDKNGEYDDRNEIRTIKKVDQQAQGMQGGFNQGGFQNQGQGGFAQGGYGNQNQGGYANANQGGFQNQNNQHPNQQQVNQNGQGFGNNTGYQGNSNQGGYQDPNQGYANNNQGMNQQGFQNQQQQVNQNQQQFAHGQQQGQVQGQVQGQQAVDNSAVQSMDAFQQGQQQMQNQQMQNQGQVQGQGQQGGSQKAPWEN